MKHIKIVKNIILFLEKRNTEPGRPEGHDPTKNLKMKTGEKNTLIRNVKGKVRRGSGRDQ